ncbi:MAG: ERF family protein [Methylobacter sp.]
MTIHELLIDIQKRLKAPKNQWNDFGKYHYRSCEDILEAVKALDTGCAVVIEDEIISIGGKNYIKATASIIDKDGNRASTTACAREAETKKGMDDAQITGATSSYARKYALNALFAIDDTKDSDSTNQHGAEEKPKTQQSPAANDDKEWFNGFEQYKAKMIADIKAGKSADKIIKSLREKYKVSTKIAEQIKALEAA